MSKLFIEDTSLTAIGDAIRSKTGKEDLIKLGDMPAKIASITTGGSGEADYSMEDGLLTRTITEYRNDRITSIGAYVFSNHSTLQKISCSNVTSAKQYVFENCISLVEIDLPKLQTTATYCFRGCSALKELILPSMTRLEGLRGCTSLEKLDIGSAKDLSTGVHQIISNTFYGDVRALHTIIIRYTVKPFSLGSGLAADCPIAQGTGYIYVPKALIEEYKVATNWVAYAEQFRAIEDYPEICGGTE